MHLETWHFEGLLRQKRGESGGFQRPSCEQPATVQAEGAAEPERPSERPARREGGRGGAYLPPLPGPSGGGPSPALPVIER